MTPDRAAVLFLSDSQLLAQCDVHTYRASGPGGQNRNKVESAVRLVHVPSGVTAVATESRSQLENRPLALRRLREALAIRLRSAVELDNFAPPAQWTAAANAGRIRVNPRNPDYPILVATALDVLEACAGRLGDATRLLGLSTHHFVQFLADHPHVWQEANRIRAAHGARPLRGQ